MLNRRKFNPADYQPRRLALCYLPPMIIVEYMKPSTGKLYLRKLRIKNRVSLAQVPKLVEALIKKYSVYFSSGKISEKQLQRLIEKLMAHGVWPNKAIDPPIKETSSLNLLPEHAESHFRINSQMLVENSMNIKALKEVNFAVKPNKSDVTKDDLKNLLTIDKQNRESFSQNSTDQKIFE